MKVVCALFGALVAVANGQAYVSYYGQDLNHPTLSKESNTPEEAQLYEQNHENEGDLLSKLLLKHYGFNGEEQPAVELPKEELQHHIRRKREIGYQHIPVIGKDGVPLDTPEVQKAKQQHFIAREVVKTQQYYPHHYENDEEGAYVPSVVPKHPHEYIPIIGKNGVPIDTPEVQFARKQHFAAIEAVKARQYHNFIVEPKESVYVENPSHFEQEIPYEQHIDGGQQELDDDYYGREKF